MCRDPLRVDTEVGLKGSPGDLGVCNTMTDTDEIQWKQPAGRAQAGAASRIADVLRANPQNWAIIEEHPVPVSPDGADEDTKDKVRQQSKQVRAKASSRASLIKKGRVAAYRPVGAFEAVSRSEDDDNGKRVIRVYARYLGDEYAEKATANAE